jgi:hypothetical protein
MLNNMLLLPPAAFLAYLLISYLFSLLTKVFRTKGTAADGKNMAYSCGETAPVNKVQPDYSQFFPFAFFFTLMHVLSLIIATVPKGLSSMPFVYLASGVVALLILFRK